YILNRFKNLDGTTSVFTNHIARSKWNYQFTRNLSLRLIGQYAAVLANPIYTSTQTTKHFDGDLLLTYLVHPGTAIYLGYNSSLQNLDPSLRLDASGNLLRSRGFINDGRQLFLKMSYQFRY